MIISHRGYAKKHPENSFEAFNAAFDAGADAIETDVRIAEDNKIVVSHDPVKSSKGLPSLDDLFAYIKEKDAHFFLELKSPSPDLLGNVLKKINRINAWERVHLIGFAKNLKTAVRSQKDFPNLLVDQILQFPLWSHLKKPKQSNAVYIGWLDGVAGSEIFFKQCVSRARLSRLRQYFEGHGFGVYGGVVNREEGMRYFQSAGINDIFTDEVETAIICLKQQQQF
ncbi:hypothetical protein BK004_04230 [bacterium CG10_46_32]|nr:MAG: hypothetical protein BK004_04230 [bacterium CG10_46_32]PIR55825.1 MAG: hypothetical protein COU73_04270 [Parcubacteria group bacterium CG10_big_fil_rev_8_21_14_0_10_46_32]